VSLDVDDEYGDIDGARKTVLGLFNERTKAGSSSLILQEFDSYPVEPNETYGRMEGWRLTFCAVADAHL
jgi:hypothetical protein